MIFAVVTSQTSDKAMKSPNEDILSAPLARAYADAKSDKSSPFGIMYKFFCSICTQTHIND